jgi:ribulose 1,5-bisphosphate synthetase/thiazole synthase
VLINLNLMIKRLIVFLLFFNCAISFAQTIKTDVLVIGGSPNGVAAAIQCARSKVKTVLVEPENQLCPELTGTETLNVAASRIAPSGIWKEFRKHIVDHYRAKSGYDTTYNAPLYLSGTVAAALLQNMADTVKNLTLETGTSFVKIVKDDDRWDVSVMHNGSSQNIKARVVIDATPNGTVMLNAGGKQNTDNEFNLNYRNDIYRTSISMGNFRPLAKGDFIGEPTVNDPPAYFVPVSSLLAKGVDNLLVIGVQWPEFNEVPETNKRIAVLYLRDDLLLGQGAGVTAAYCAFFKTTTANLNIRAIQGELLDFKGNLLPIDDLDTDKYWRPIQQVCATGMLKLAIVKEKDGFGVLFCPDSIVTTAEIKPVMLEIYTRAFIWFNKEKPGAQFTIGNLLSFISELTLTDPDNLQKSISKAWTEQFHFTSSFDPDRPITRREFAILANKYLNPFGRRIDLDGKIVN